MSNILTEVNKAQTHDEVIEALRAQVRVLTANNKTLLECVKEYASEQSWYRTMEGKHRCHWNYPEDGNKYAKDTLAKLAATTAPTPTGA